MSLMNSVYQAFLNIGWSPSQAKIMTAEVGRENDFNPKFVFGRHTDASNGKVNLGMISWQGSRGAALDKRLKSKGLIKNGRIVQSQAALNEMALFMEHEIKTNPAYAVTKKAFLNNPNVSYDVGKKVLGNNFIRWDYSGKAVLGANVGKHHAKRDGYYRKLGGQGGTNYSPQQGGYQQPPTRPNMIPISQLQAAQESKRPQLTPLSQLQQPKAERPDLVPLSELQGSSEAMKRPEMTPWSEIAKEPEQPLQAAERPAMVPLAELQNQQSEQVQQNALVLAVDETKMTGELYGSRT